MLVANPYRVGAEFFEEELVSFPWFGSWGFSCGRREPAALSADVGVAAAARQLLC